MSYVFTPRKADEPRVTLSIEKESAEKLYAYAAKLRMSARQLASILIGAACDRDLYIELFRKEDENEN
jgi:hypothetical protein